MSTVAYPSTPVSFIQSPHADEWLITLNDECTGELLVLCEQVAAQGGLAGSLAAKLFVGIKAAMLAMPGATVEMWQETVTQ